MISTIFLATSVTKKLDHNKNNNCLGCVKGGMGYWNKIRRDFPDVFARRAKQEREIGHSCINGVFLDELDPDRGNINTEVMEDCTIACQLLTWGK